MELCLLQRLPQYLINPSLRTMSYMPPDTVSLPQNSKPISSLQSECEITRLKKEIEHLKLSNIHLGDEVSSLKNEAHSYCEENSLTEPPPPNA